MDEFEAWSRTLTSREVLAALDRQNVPASAYRAVAEVMQDPQLAHRDAFAIVEDQGGSFKVLNPPFRMSASATKAGGFVAALGEHTGEVLDSLELSEEERRQLKGPTA